MSCQEFDSVSVELARGSLIDAAALESALAHAAGCAPCAARLRREQALSAALGEVTASMRGCESPVRVEGVLLAAFRERRATVSVASIDGARAPRVASRLALMNRRALISAAVAASLVVAFVVAWRVLAAKTRVDTDSARKSSVEPLVKSPEVKPPDVAQTTGKQTTEMNIVAVKSTRGNSNITRSRARRRAEQSVDDLPIVFTEQGGRIVSDPASTGGANGATDLGASADFVPLMTADGSAPLDGGQMVRVQMPRAALAAWGLPVNAERAGETVKADLLLAHDGTARAIRLRP
jgi:hypothetical protein